MLGTKFSDGSAHILGPEGGSPSDEHVGAVSSGNGSGSGVDSPVDLEVVVKSMLLSKFAGFFQLRHGLSLHKRLASETGDYGHDEKEIEIFIHVGQGLGEGGGRVEYDSSHKAGFLDPLESLPEAAVVLGLDMDRDAFGAGFNKAIEVVVGSVDHEVSIAVDRGSLAGGFYHGWAAKEEKIVLPSPHSEPLEIFTRQL